jgi:alpha-D-ribose 1-methylphosphonate 5-triphosphate diphosphatase
MNDPLILENVRLVLADRASVGWIALEAGRIAAYGDGRAPERGIDCTGELLVPGLVELHTDHLEAHIEPRPKVMWNALSAVLAYDAQIAASGITTVFDSLRLGAASEDDGYSREAVLIADTIREAAAARLLRVDHRTHLRCEIATHDVGDAAEEFFAAHPVGMISLMDHTPGQRQFRDMDKMRQYYAKHGYSSEDSFNALVEKRLKQHHAYAERQRRRLVAMAQSHGAAIASHDDATVDQVAEAVADKVSIAEFPTTVEAAAASHEAGMAVLMGAPNLVRGGSHSGNVAAEELARLGLLDILSSDYVPASLLLAAFMLPTQVETIDLPAAIRLVTKNPAEAVGLHDRGEIAVGKRADLVRLSIHDGQPVVRAVYREGVRVV